MLFRVYKLVQSNKWFDELMCLWCEKWKLGGYFSISIYVERV